MTKRSDFQLPVRASIDADARVIAWDPTDANGEPFVVPVSVVAASTGLTDRFAARNAIVVASNDATAAIKSAADYVCDGTDDQVQINAALIAASALVAYEPTASGTQRGCVELTGGRFNCSGSILMQTGVWLKGAGVLTEVRPDGLTAATGAGAGVALVKKANTTVHLTKLSDMWLHSFSTGSCHGILYDRTGAAGDATNTYPATSPDDYDWITDLFVSRFTTGTRHGIWSRGDIRGMILDRITVRGVSGNGVWMESGYDNHLSAIHVSATLDGFVLGANNKTVNCKAFYCATGFRTTSSRNIMSGCDSQENTIGYDLQFGDFAGSALQAGSCDTDGFVIAGDSTAIAGLSIVNTFGSDRFTTCVNGVRFVGTPTNSQISGAVNATNVTNAVVGNFREARNAISISNGRTVVAWGDHHYGQSLLEGATLWLDAANISGATWTNTGSAGTALNATITGSPTVSTDSLTGRQIVTLNGTSQFAEIADTALLDFAAADSFTLLAVTRESSFVASHCFLAKATGGGTTLGYSMRAGFGTPAQSTFEIGDGAAGTTIGSVNRTAGRLHLVTAVRNVTADTVRTQVTAVPGTTATDATTTTLENAQVFRVGRYSGAGTNYYAGAITAVAVFRRALTAGELQAIGGFYGVA